jgi:hypothetical protein
MHIFLHSKLNLTESSTISHVNEMQIHIRLACLEDIPALEAQISESARTLQANYFIPAQIEGTLGTVFGVDTQLIQDQTYFIAETSNQIIGCGG